MTSPATSTSSRAIKTHHRRSRSFSAPLLSEADSDPDQPWRSREAWLALHARPSSPPPTPSLPSTGWRSRNGGAAFFGGESERTLLFTMRNRAGSTSSSSSDRTIIATPSVDHEANATKHLPHSGTAHRLLRMNSLASHQRDDSPSSEEGEIIFLPPLLPQTGPTAIKKMPSFTCLRTQADKPVPWGRRPITPIVRSTDSPLPITPPALYRSSSRITSRQASSQPPIQRRLDAETKEMSPPVPVRNPLRGDGIARRLRMIDRADGAVSPHPSIASGTNPEPMIRNFASPIGIAPRQVGQPTAWSERSSGEEGGVRRGGWI